MMLLEQKKTLFTALVREALDICPLRPECLSADVRGLVLAFIARYRDVLLSSMEGRGMHEEAQEHMLLLDAIENFARYHSVEMLLKIKGVYDRTDLMLLRSMADELLPMYSAMQVSYVIEWGGRMLEHATCQQDCWQYVRGLTQGRLCKHLWRISSSHDLRDFRARVHAELDDSEARQQMMDHASYYYNRLSRWGKPIIL